MKKILVIPVILALLFGVFACGNDEPTQPGREPIPTPPNTDTISSDTPVSSDTINEDPIGGGCMPIYLDEDKFEYPYTAELLIENIDGSEIYTNSKMLYTFIIPSREVLTTLYVKQPIIQDILYISIDNELISYERIYTDYNVCTKVISDYVEIDITNPKEIFVKISENNLERERHIEVCLYGASSAGILRFIQAAK